MSPQEIFRQLQTVKGLKPLTYLEDKHKKFVESHEQKNNLGVFDALKRQHTLLLVHDSSFRDPAGPIVQKYISGVIFPSVPFPEVEAKNVISSSPSREVHEKLLKQLHLSVTPQEATLLIGFDLS